MADPYYDEILTALAGELDDRVFEDCVCDLLRDVFPSLVLIRGGNDAGMDGAVADGLGEAFPLVVTTAKDYLRNVRRSLDRYREKGGRRDRVVVALSQDLTPIKRRDLESAIEKRGFVPVQIFERRGLADRLYGDARWCRDLLGLTGRPSALSAIPRTRRPLVDAPLIGRDEALAWLRRPTSGDRLLISGPGMGKTAMLATLAREGWGLFLVDPDGTVIANAIRSQNPSTIVVDDAHEEPRRLVDLRRLREEIGASFGIVAVSWPGAWEEKVRDALGGDVGAEAQFRLEGLTRSEMIELVRAVGVGEPDEVVGALVDQADNKPGLAVLLAKAWLRGAWRDAADGGALLRAIGPILEDLGGTNARAIAAGFASSGDRGIAMDAVGKILEVPPAKMQAVTRGLAAAGIVALGDGRTLTVWPPSLRSALVRDAFFRGDGTDLDIEPFLDAASDRTSALVVLLGAVARGERIPDALRRAVHSSHAAEVWGRYAELDRNAALDTLRRASDPSEVANRAPIAGRLSATEIDSPEAFETWANAQEDLEAFPGDVLLVAWSTLVHAPSETIDLLLARAQDPPPSCDPLETARDSLQPIRKWLGDVWNGHSGRWDVVEALERRRMLVERARVLGREGGARHVVAAAIRIALEPGLEARVRGADGATKRDRTGALPVESIEGLRPLWDDWIAMVSELGRGTASELSALIFSWTHPRSSTKAPLSDRDVEAMRVFARYLVTSLVPLAEGRPGTTIWLRRLAEPLGLALDLPLERPFQVLARRALGEAVTDRAVEIEAWVRAWIGAEPRKGAVALKALETEAAFLDLCPKTLVDLASRLSESVENPRPWLDAVLEVDSSPVLVQPFLDLAVRQAHDPDALLADLLDDARWATIASHAVLCRPVPDAALLARAIAVARRSLHLLVRLCSGGALSDDVLRKLLGVSGDVSTAVAIGLARRPGGVPTSLVEAWREAVLRIPAEIEADHDFRGFSYDLAVQLGQDSALAVAWLRRKLADGNAFAEAPYLVDRACAALTLEQRIEVVGNLIASPKVGALVRPLVQRDPVVFRAVLERPELRDFHLLPIMGADLTNEILVLVEVALDAGKRPEDIAGAILGSWFVSGSGLDHWSQWRERLDTLTENREGLRGFAGACRAIVEERIAGAREDQRAIDLHGLEGVAERGRFG